jgi:hypothetical protein
MKNIFLLIPILISCQPTQDNNQLKENSRIIDLDKVTIVERSLKMSEIAETIDYIALETSDKAFITQGAHFRATDNYFLLSQRGQIKQFDQSGKFIRNLVNVGRGPGEGFSRCFEVDDSSDNLFMYSNFAHNIIKYNLNSGININTFKDPETEFWTDNLHYYKGNLLFISNSASEKFFFKVYSLDDMQCILTWPIKYQTNFRSLNSIAEYSSTYAQNIDSALLIKEMFSDTIYLTTDFKDLKPRYIFNGGEKLAYQSFQQFLSDPGKATIDNKLIIGRFFETSKSLFFYGFNGKKINLYMYDKIENKLRVYNGKEIINDLDNGINFKINWDPHSTIYYKGNIYCIIDIFQNQKELKLSNLKSDKLKEILKGVDEFSNPILMIVKLKN